MKDAPETAACTGVTTMLKNESILLADPDEAVSTALYEHISRFGYEVYAVENGKDAISFCEKEEPCILVMEADLPDMSGFDVCRKLQSAKYTSRIPIVFFTKREEEMDVVVGFQLGALDYVSKKNGYRELSLRIIAILRRCRPTHFKKRITVGRVVVDFEQSIAIQDGKRLALSPTEFQIFGVLAREEGRVLRRREIISQVWRDDESVMKRTVDAYVKALREKLNDAALTITTIRGLGYSLRTDAHGDEENKITGELNDRGANRPVKEEQVTLES